MNWLPPDSAHLTATVVHNHGPAEGRGLDCPEHLVDGQLRGVCIADRDHLRAVAEAATPGPWGAHVLGSEGYDVRATLARPGRLPRVRVARCGYEDWDTDKANAEYVATFDPPTVLGLLQALERVEALHQPWYEVNGVRHHTTVTVHKDDVPAGHVCRIDPNHPQCSPQYEEHEVLACSECRQTTDDGEPGLLFWPCPTARAITGMGSVVPS